LVLIMASFVAWVVSEALRITDNFEIDLILSNAPESRS
jgi:hypothetical protein